MYIVIEAEKIVDFDDECGNQDKYIEILRQQTESIIQAKNKTPKSDHKRVISCGGIKPFIESFRKQNKGPRDSFIVIEMRQRNSNRLRRFSE